MSEVRVDPAQALANLKRAWQKAEAGKSGLDPNIVGQIDAILQAKDVTFRYILVTGVLAKLTNPKAHPRALQTQSSLDGAYDARSLCHNVVVPFEKSKGNLFGMSNEPFVNKPARHAEHRGDNPQLRNSRGAAALHRVLEIADKSSPDIVEKMLVEILTIGKAKAESQVVALPDLDTNLKHLVDFVDGFLKENDGGARLAAVTGAFIRLLNDSATVKVYRPNASDTFAKTAGDVEVIKETVLVSAYECKHRPITKNDVIHGIKKAKEKGVSEYCFVIAAGYATGEQAEIKALIASSQAELDVSLIELDKALLPWAVALNPTRRAVFGDAVTDILRDEMKRSEVADQAAQLWNSLGDPLEE
jgi:hypothetical protein